ncbi:MAG: hypothetical protein Q8P02_01735 [Candidatus Micrarchaeota archaeon]|nr:hypothetical protein [Candidatus Micrarchaeota archaeon]
MSKENRCADCGQYFGSAEALTSHRHAKHYASSPKKRFDVKQHKGKFLLGVLLLLAGVMVYAFAQGTVENGGGGVAYPPRISNTPIHWHSQLDITVDGVPVPIPKDIGIGARHEPLHTHEPDGVIHVESADTRDYTLGNFFQVWGKPLDAQCVGEYCGSVRMSVDGKESSEFGNLVLRDGQRIVLQVQTQAGLGA